MKSLAEEIVAALPSLMADHPLGPKVRTLARVLVVSEMSIRNALTTLKKNNLAIIVRYPGSRAKHVVPLDHYFPPMRYPARHRRRVCAWCDTLYDNGSRKFCSKSCFAQHMWANPERRAKAHIAGKRAARLPSRMAVTEKLIALQKSPEGRDRQRERNRRAWADPAHKAKRSASLQAALSTPEARARLSKIAVERWEKPGFREKASASMREARADPEVKKRYSEAAKRRWRDQGYLEKMAPHVEAFGKRVRGRKQTPQEKAKRVESRQRNTIARGYHRRPGEVTRPDSKPKWKR